MEVGNSIRMARKSKNMTLEDLAHLAGTDTGNLSRLERGLQGVSQDLLERILDALGMSLSNTIAENTVPYSPNSSTVQMRLVPLISWINAGKWGETMAGFSEQEAIEWIACPVKHSRQTYALTVRGESMFNPSGEKSFRDGDVIYVDPEKVPANKSFVVVAIAGSSEATFKQLIIEGESMYLKPLNPNWPEPVIKLPHDSRICGVVIFKGETV